MTESNQKILRKINLKKRRHVFKKFRYDGVRFSVPMFLSFSIVDYFYSKEFALAWTIYRFGFAVSMFTTLYMLKKAWFRNKYSELAVALNLLVASDICNVMIWQYGEYRSPYVMGVILISLIGINIYRLPKRFILLSLGGSYVPTMLIVSYLAGRENWVYATIVCLIMISIVCVHYVYSNDDENLVNKITSKEYFSGEEIVKLKRTEIFKYQFPQSLREKIETTGNQKYFAKQVLPNAVVGFMDITNSAALSNLLPLATDWILRERFMEAASQIATKYEFIVITNLGDGFLFLGNYEGTNDWSQNLRSFHEEFIKKFDEITADLFANLDLDLDLGIKCGVSLGPVMIGFMGETQVYFTAVGPDVNLASRLSSRAQKNELIVTARIWDFLTHVSTGWQTEESLFTDLKGFSTPINSVRIKMVPTHSESEPICPTCQSKLVLFKDSEGVLDVKCPQGHEVESTLSKRIA